ncbi:MAG: hypothetical protein ABL891_06430 [Burkholderiales bacterium]
MKTVKTEKQFDPLGSRTFGSVALLALFGIPLAIHLAARFLL